MKVENLKVGDYYYDPRSSVYRDLKVEFESLEQAYKNGFLLWKGVTDDWKLINRLNDYKRVYKKNPAAYVVYKEVNNKVIECLALHK